MPGTQFFVDSAGLGESRKALSTGLCDGVTTDPSLVARTGRSFDEALKEIGSFVAVPVSSR